MSAPPTSGLIAGLDPGTSKSGLVLADCSQGQILQAAILAPQASQRLLLAWQQRGLARVVLGNGTGSSSWSPLLQRRNLELTLVDEHGSSLAARHRYWELHPPNLLLRLLPAGLRLPPRDIDDVVAQLLLERCLGKRLQRSCGEVLRQWPPNGFRNGPAP
jgi:hypothetical protein